MKLDRNFYDRNTLKVAEELIGKILVRKINGKTYKAEILETEAYVGFEDKASHASRGMTPRNLVMFGKPGIAYVYMIYGMYYCLNFVTENAGYPAAVLIRALKYPNADGPGKLCREFEITKENANGFDLMGDEIYVENSVIKYEIENLPRIGVSYADEAKDWPWRFKAKI